MADQQQIVPRAPQAAKVTAATFGAKYTNKREVYRFLATEANVYLPPMDNVTIWHLRDLAMGERKRIDAKDVKHIAIPQFEGLSIKYMLEWAQKVPAVMKALPPTSKEVEKFPR